MYKKLAIVFMILLPSIAFSAEEISCKKPIPIQETVAWKRHCTYYGTSLHDAYHTYLNTVQSFSSAVPHTLPSKNRKFRTPDFVEVSVIWKGRNQVFVSEIFLDAENSGREVQFKKAGSQVKIVETGWTP